MEKINFLFFILLQTGEIQTKKTCNYYYKNFEIRINGRKWKNGEIR